MKTSFIVQLLMLVIALPALGFGRAHAGPPAKLAIMSDCDDTVRPTGTLHWKRGQKVARGKKTVKAFSGISELYKQLLLTADADWTKDEYIISGSPLFLSFSLDDFLKENGFSIEHMQIRYFGPVRDIAKYKEHEFEKYLTANPKTPFIFLGDDGEKDADAIAWAKDRFPNQVLAQYIHSIEGVMPAKRNQVPYFTAVEVALHEMTKGRLKPEQVDVVAQAMLDDDQFEWDVIPVYAKLCPKTDWITTLMTDNLHVTMPPATMVKIDDIQKRVAAICTPDRKPRDFEDPNEDPFGN